MKSMRLLRIIWGVHVALISGHTVPDPECCQSAGDQPCSRSASCREHGITASHPDHPRTLNHNSSNSATWRRRRPENEQICSWHAGSQNISTSKSSPIRAHSRPCRLEDAPVEVVNKIVGYCWKHAYCKFIGRHTFKIIQNIKFTAVLDLQHIFVLHT